MNSESIKNEINELMITNDINAAYDLLLEYRIEFGQDEFYILTYADIFMFYQDYDTVIPYLEKNFKMNENFYERLADCYFGIQNFQKAKQYYLKCDYQHLNAYSFRILFMLASTSYNLQEYEKSVSYFEDYLLDNEDVDAYFFCACAYYFLDQYKEMKEYFNKVKNMEGTDRILQFLLPDTNTDLFDVYVSFNSDFKIYQTFHLLKTHFYDKAYFFIQTFEEVFYKHYLLGMYYLELKDLNNANFEFEKALSCAFKEEYLKYYLDILQTSTLDFSKYLKNLFELSKEDPYLYLFILNYYYEHCLYRECISFFEKQECIEPIENEMRLHTIILSCLYYLKEYESGLDYLEFYVDRPYPLSIQVIQVQFLFALNQDYEALQLAYSLLPNGKIAEILINYYLKTNQEDCIAKVKKIMKDARSNSEYIPDLENYIDSYE